MGDPLVSIVTGTYNRLPSLQRMAESIRSQLPRHIPYEIVIVDGGSTDGTIEWCLRQPDVRLIEHGNLRGAIVAFCDGARASLGDYVIMGNDDITYQYGSILRAIAHLEDHPTCGAVAFADNRYSLVHNESAIQHRVMQMPAIGTDGGGVSVNYAQVGLFRRWLGDLVGWWGDRDPVMGQARTYGGDNWLSSKLWELGYSVDAVPGCAIDDHFNQHRDALRNFNHQQGSADSQQYYTAFPRGAQLKEYPQVSNPQRERLRIVLMDIHERPARLAKEAGLAEALAKVGLLWHIDYINEAWILPDAVKTWQPHLLVIQMHDTSRINAGVLSAARMEKPDMVVVNWNGDAHERGLVSPDILEALRFVDLQTVVNAKVLPIYQREEIPAAYWQIGAKLPASPYPGEVPHHEVLVQMNCYNEARHALLAKLRAIRFDRRKLNLGVYGNCPGTDGNTHHDFAHQAALNANADIVVGDTYPGTIGFVSNRLFQVLSAGGFLLQQHSPRLSDFTGLLAGVHYEEWTTLADLERKIKFWLQPAQAEARKRIAQEGQRFAMTNFTYDAQVKKLFLELLPSLE